MQFEQERARDKEIIRNYIERHKKVPKKKHCVKRSVQTIGGTKKKKLKVF